MSGSAVLEGLFELRLAMAVADERLADGLRKVSMKAAEAGILEARTDHPYTDRTFHLSGLGDGGDDTNSHATETDDGEAYMVWPVPYASFVDKGTSRSRPYPFTPQAEDKAAEVLQRETELMVDRVMTKL